MQETGKELQFCICLFLSFYIAKSRKKNPEGNGIVQILIKPTHYIQKYSKTGNVGTASH